MGIVKPFKEKEKPFPFEPRLMAAWNSGFAAGAKQQRESDIKSLVNLLEDLETIPGIGEKRAWKLREHFLRKFEKKE